MADRKPSRRGPLKAFVEFVFGLLTVAGFVLAPVAILSFARTLLDPDYGVLLTQIVDLYSDTIREPIGVVLAHVIEWPLIARFWPFDGLPVEVSEYLGFGVFFGGMTLRAESYVRMIGAKSEGFVEDRNPLDSLAIAFISIFVWPIYALHSVLRLFWAGRVRFAGQEALDEGYQDTVEGLERDGRAMLRARPMVEKRAALALFALELHYDKAAIERPPGRDYADLLEALIESYDRAYEQRKAALERDDSPETRALFEIAERYRDQYGRLMLQLSRNRRLTGRYARRGKAEYRDRLSDDILMRVVLFFPLPLALAIYLIDLWF